MMEQERLTTAFVLSLIGGVLILLGGGMMSVFGCGGMMSMFGTVGYQGFDQLFALGLGFFGILGSVFGVIVIISSIMLYSKPQQHTTWGILIAVFSVLNIFGSAMGGLILGLVGLILGLIGGALAVTWKPSKSLS